MTQSNPTQGLMLPPVARRSPKDIIYRVSSTLVGNAASQRVLGMWVPAEAFRRGTIIRFTGNTSSASPVFILSVGGPGTLTTGGGVTLTWTTGPAAAVGFNLTATQRFDGIIPTFDAGGFFSGATSLVVTTGTFAPFIQPVNFVSVSTNGTFSLFGCALEVIVPQTNVRPAGEIFAT